MNRDRDVTMLQAGAGSFIPGPAVQHSGSRNSGNTGFPQAAGTPVIRADGNASMPGIAGSMPDTGEAG